MASESFFNLLVEYGETDRQQILSVITKILAKIEMPKYRSISRHRLQKKTKHSEVIFNILYIAGFKDNEAKTRITLSYPDIITAQNVFRLIQSHDSSIKPMTSVEESKSNSSHVQTLTDMGFAKDQSERALQAASGNIELAAQFMLQNHDIDGAQVAPNTTQECCVETCSAVIKISNKLDTYKGSLNAYVSREIVPLLNVWNHLLMYHDNDHDFEYIYNTLNKCDIKHCLIAKRHHRDRSTETTEMSRISHSHDTMDRIHSYLLHSYDTGYRLKSHDKEAITHNKQLQLFGQFTHNKHTLSRYTALTSARKEVIGSHYSFGQQFYYWDYFKKDTHRHHGYERNEWYIPPKYGSLKNELVNNQLAIITKAQWNAQYEKVTKHHKTKYCKQITAQPSGAGRLHDLDAGVKGELRISKQTSVVV
eukprot:379372_1